MILLLILAQVALLVLWFAPTLVAEWSQWVVFLPLILIFVVLVIRGLFIGGLLYFFAGRLCSFGLKLWEPPCLAR